jgi:hypothetical protein
MKKLLVNLMLAAFIGSGSLAAAATPASAEVVCNAEHECWHAHGRIAYPGAGYEHHPDDWYFHRTWAGGPYRWHDYHEGRGYWRRGVWVQF